MLLHAQYRHPDHRTAYPAGKADVTTTSEHGYTSSPSGQITQRPNIKIFSNKTYYRYQKVCVATGPADKTVEDIYRPGSDLQTYCGQHPPPRQKNGTSPHGMIRSKGPPPKLMDSSLHLGGLIKHLMWPDITEYTLRSDRLSLALQQPSPTKGRTTVRRARWKINGQHPPPLQKNGASPPRMIKLKSPPPKLMDSSLHCGGLIKHLMWPDITEYALRSDRLSLALQQPPPTKGRTTVRRARWKINWQHPPPLQKNGASPPRMIKLKDPPPKLMDSSLLYGGFINHLAWPDITEYALRSDRLSLALQQPPPTKGQATVRCARWKLNWQHLPPTTMGAARYTVSHDTSLRPLSAQMAAKSITVRGDIPFFSIETGAAPYDLKFLQVFRAYRDLKTMQSPLSFMQIVSPLPLKETMSGAIYSCEKVIYLTSLKKVSMLANLKNQNRQILPSNVNFNDHICLVGNICLASKAHERKQNIP